LLARQDAFLSDIIASVSCLFALYNSKDINYRAAAAFAFETASEKMLLSEIVSKLHLGGGREAPGSLARESPSTLSVNNGAKRGKKQNTLARVTIRAAEGKLRRCIVEAVASPRVSRRVMYKTFRVKNFCCFENLQIKDLGRVNLIAGPNNTGKTALLEAMYLHTRPFSPGELTNLQQARGINFDDDSRMRSWRQSLFTEWILKRP